MRNFIMPDRVKALRPTLALWAKKLTGKKLDQLKETELLPDFITDIFGGVLGYAGPVSKFDIYSMKREGFVKVDGKYADAVFGEFGLGKERFVAVLEGKGPKDPLDRPFAGRHKSAVEQAMNYAVQLKIDWYIVTNMRETRLYYNGEGMVSSVAQRRGSTWSAVTGFSRMPANVKPRREVPAMIPTYVRRTR